VIAQQLDDAPSLIPIFLHRAIPNEPLEEGNPVFSFWQAIDVIVYGIDLGDYLTREFHTVTDELIGLGRPIRFWKNMLDPDSAQSAS
jgi:hypothetical protein